MTESFYTSVEKYGKNLLFRGYHDGVQVNRRVKFKPTLYIPSNNKNSEYQTLFGFPLDPYKPGDMKECYEFVKKHEDISNFDIYGNTDYVSQFICKNFSESKPDRDLINRLTFDIEVDSEDGFPQPDVADKEINSIAARSSLDNVYHVWTYAEYEPEDTILEDIDIKHHECKNEKEILKKFLEFWTSRYPDIITGWGIEYFDVTYLYNRLYKVFGPETANSLSPWNVVHEKEIYRSGRYEIIYKLRGIQNLDYIKVFKKFAYNYPPQESYKLDHIAHVVLKKGKVNYEKYGSLQTLFKENPQLYVDYNIEDVRLVDQMDEKEDLIHLVMLLAYKGGVNFEDTFGSVKIWDTYIYKELIKQKIVIPPNKNHSKHGAIEGGHVKDPYVGMHHYIASFDLNSLYPHIIMQYNMSPETIADEFVSGVEIKELLRKKDYEFDRSKYCMAASGQLFRKDRQGVLPRIVEELYDERKTYKSKKNEDKKKLHKTKGSYEKNELEKEIAKSGNMEVAIKILMNSLYGAMSNKYFRYFDDRIAESITLCGQLAIRWAEESINEYLNKIMGMDNYDFVVAIDTDSLYLRLGPLVSKVFNEDKNIHKKIDFLDKVCEEKINPKIEESYQRMAEYLAVPQQKMEMKREILADKGIWTRKKRYVLNVYDDEGVRYEEPKLKVVGLETKRSDIPSTSRELIGKTIEIIMTENQQKTQRFILDNRKAFREYSPEEIAFSKTASQIQKFSDASNIYRKSTPIHVRGALLYNHYLKKFGLENKYESINEGDKVQYVYLKLPNPIGENVVSFPSYLPPELKVRKYVDHDTQFDKTYVVPIQSILSVLGWTAEAQGTLEGFMK